MEQLLIVAVCLVFNALFAGYEMAFVSVSKSELSRLAREGQKEAKRLLALRHNPERTLSVIQIGITLVSALAAAVGGAGAAKDIQPYFINRFGMGEVTAEILSVGLIVLPLTYLSVVLGELVPKSIALRNPVEIVLGGAKWLFLADRLLSPVVSLLEWSTKALLRLITFRARPLRVENPLSVEVDALSPKHRQYVLNLTRIEDKRISDFMVPWALVNHIQTSFSLDEVLQVALTTGHTRLPVTDEHGSVMGILHTKEFLALRELGEREWQKILRAALKVPTGDTALQVIRRMQDARSHMAIVCSPSGAQIGIVTLEDIIEEIVGDLYDEDDDSRIMRILASRNKARHPADLRRRASE